MANVNARRVEEILTSGITAGHYVAGSNITITENQDGTETIASTGGGGGGGFTPTETQLAAMNSGITEAKVTGYDALPDDEDVKDIVSDHFVAGSNITITNNVDGTQTIASTASGGTTDYSDLTNKPSINNVTLSGDKTTSDLGIDEVPDVTSSDDGKILKASYSGSTGTYSWDTLSSTEVTSALSSAQQSAIDSGITSYWFGEFRKVYENCNPEHIYSNLAVDSGGKASYVHEATGNYVNIPGLSTQAVLQRIFTNNNYIEYAWDINGNHAIRYSSGDWDTPIWSNWLVMPAPSAAPTAYTTPTAGTGVTNVVGGYVIANNICTVNISCKFNSPNTGQVLFSDLPKPALKPGSTDATISNVFVVGSTSTDTAGKGGAHVYLTQGGSIICSDESYGSLGANSKIITGSYLVNTST